MQSVNLFEHDLSRALKAEKRELLTWEEMESVSPSGILAIPYEYTYAQLSPIQRLFFQLPDARVLRRYSYAVPSRADYGMRDGF